MNKIETLKFIAAQRKERAVAIVANPGAFKLCEGCGSLLFNNENNHRCPYCNAYRFDYNREAILEAAKILGNKPMSDGCPYLPRFATKIAMSYA